MLFTDTKAKFFPMWIFIFVWVLVFALYITSPYPYLDIRSQTIVFIGLSMAGFVIGYMFLPVFQKEAIVLYTSDKSGSVKSLIEINENSAVKIMTILSVIALIGLSLKLQILGEYAGGVMKYLENPIRARFIVSENVGKITAGYQFAETVAGYISNVNFLGVILGGVFFAAARRHNLVGLIPLVISLLWSAITFQRWVLMMSFIFFLTTALYTVYYLPDKRNKKVIRRIFYLGLVAMTIFVSFSIVLIASRQALFSDIEVGSQLDYALKSIHSYITGNVVSLDQYLRQADGSPLWGTSIFRVFFKWFARLGLYDSVQVLTTNYEFTWTGINYLNTYTYLRIFYEDFGYIGMVMISFLWGFLTYWIVILYLNRFSLYRIFFVSVFVHSVFMSFFSFSVLNIIFLVYISSLIFIVKALYPQLIEISRSP